LGGKSAVCAQRLEDDVVECMNGTFLDWGPLSHLTVSALQYRASNRWVQVFDEDFEPSICAITIDDEVRCQGDYFAPEVLDALADL
jgi:hypothetical protein